MIASLAFTNAHNRLNGAITLTGVDILAGANGRGKSTTLLLLACVLRGPSGGVFPGLGSPDYDWSATVVVGGNTITRAGADHKVTVNGSKKPIKTAQKEIDALVGPAGAFALDDVLAMKSQDQARFFAERIYATATADWSSLPDGVNAEELKGTAATFTAYAGIAQIPEGAEKGAKVVAFGAGVHTDLAPAEYTRLAAWHTEQAIPALAAEAKGLATQIKALIDPADLPPGTTEQAKGRAEALRADIDQQKTAKGVWLALRHDRERAEAERDKVAAEEAADPYPMPPASPGSGSTASIAVLQKRIAPYQERIDKATAELAALDAEMDEQSRLALAVPKPAEGPLADKARALIEELAFDVLTERAAVAYDDLSTALKGDPLAALDAEQAADKVVDLSKRRAALVATLERLQTAIAEPTAQLRALERPLEDHKVRMAQQEGLVTAWKSRNDKRKERREAAQQTLDAIAEQTVTWSGEEELAAKQALLTDAQAALTALTRADGVRRTRAEAQARLAKVDKATAAIKAARKVILEARAALLAQVVEPLVGPANVIIRKVIPNAEIVIDDGAGWGWSLRFGDDPHGKGSHSERTMAEAAMTCAILNRMGGQRVLVVDDLEQADETRRSAFLSALVDEVREGRLDNAVLAMVEQASWQPPAGVNIIPV